jgi:hypothetical protein
MLYTYYYALKEGPLLTLVILIPLIKQKSYLLLN